MIKIHCLDCGKELEHFYINESGKLFRTCSCKEVSALITEKQFDEAWEKATDGFFPDTWDEDTCDYNERITYSDVSEIKDLLKQALGFGRKD